MLRLPCRKMGANHTPMPEFYEILIVLSCIEEGLTFNGTHQLLAYADDVIIVGENIDTIQKNTKALLDAEADKRQSIKIVNRSFEDAA
jgi:hypothetical protein